MSKQIRGVSLSELATVALFLVFSGVMWWGAAGVLGNGSRFGLFALGVLGSAVLLTLLNVIEGTHKSVRRVGLLLGFLLSVPIAFQFDFLIGLLAAALGALFAETGAFRVQWARKNYRTTPIGALTHAGLPFYFSALSIVLSVFTFLSPVGSRIVINPFPESWIREALHIANPFAESLTGFPVDGTVDQIASKITGSKDPRVLAEIRKNFEKRIGFSVAGDQDFATIISTTVERQLMTLQEKFSGAFRFSFFVGAFLLFRVLFIPFGWLTIVSAYIFTKLLRSLGGIVEVEEPAVRLVIRWP